MFSRVSQLARHLSRPLPNQAHASTALLQRKQRSTANNIIMASSVATTANEPDSKKVKKIDHIDTAACLIIGDEILGGKAGLKST